VGGDGRLAGQHGRVRADRRWLDRRWPNRRWAKRRRDGGRPCWVGRGGRRCGGGGR
jgi:hypothetical protein